MKKSIWMIVLITTFLVLASCSTKENSDSAEEKVKITKDQINKINLRINGKNVAVTPRLECLGKEECKGKTKDTVKAVPDGKDWETYLKSLKAPNVQASGGDAVEISFPMNKPSKLYFQSPATKEKQEITNQTFNLIRSEKKKEYYIITAMWGKKDEREAIVQIPLVIKYMEGANTEG